MMVRSKSNSSRIMDKSSFSKKHFYTWGYKVRREAGEGTTLDFIKKCNTTQLIIGK